MFFFFFAELDMRYKNIQDEFLCKRFKSYAYAYEKEEHKQSERSTRCASLCCLERTGLGRSIHTSWSHWLSPFKPCWWRNCKCACDMASSGHWLICIKDRCKRDRSFLWSIKPRLVLAVLLILHWCFFIFTLHPNKYPKYRTRTWVVSKICT